MFDTRLLSRSPGSERTETRTVPAPAGLSAGLAHVPEGAPISLSARLESVTEGVLVTADAAAPLAGQCARCLEPVERGLEVHLQELFSYRQSATEDVYSLQGGLLDLEPALRDALVLALPLAPLCQDDCPGLCAVCGVLLAKAGPGHSHGEPVDPRLAGLAQLQAGAGPSGPPGSA